MSKKSKVVKVTSSGTWESKREPKTTYYRYEIEMENGDIGEYSSVSSSIDDIKFKEGEEINYIYDTSRSDFPKIKPSYSNFNNNNNNNCPPNSCNNKEIARAVGVKSAIELGVAQGLQLSEILETAKILSDFILKDKECKSKENSDCFIEM